MPANSRWDLIRRLRVKAGTAIVPNHGREHFPLFVALVKWVCARSLAGIAGSNPAEVMHGCLSLVSVVCCQKSLRLADHSSRGVLPSVCHCV